MKSLAGVSDGELMKRCRTKTLHSRLREARGSGKVSPMTSWKVRCLGSARWVLAAVALACGCASNGHGKGRHNADEKGRLKTEEGVIAATPPAFLRGPIGVLLTNAYDFTARVKFPEKEETTSDQQALAGNLFAQEGRLLFVPTSDVSPRARSWAGSFRFLWDVSRNQGYVLSERLQGYAMITSTTTYTSVSIKPRSVDVIEKVDDQPCRLEEATVQASNGSTTTFLLWRPVDFQGPPLRMKPEGSTNSPRVELSDVTVEAQSAELFSPPDFFTKYSSPESMVHEIARRQMLQRYGPGRLTR